MEKTASSGTSSSTPTPTPTTANTARLRPAAAGAANSGAAATAVPAPADEFPARFKQVHQEKQQERRSLLKRGFSGFLQHGIWKGSYTIGTHTALVMLEPWEVILVLVVVSLFVAAVTFYIAYRLPAHSQVAAERAAYYLFGTRSSSAAAAAASAMSSSSSSSS
ncbi:hypothetical protein OC834_004228 [Tilletia horrida]|nr:hypothetical protein OC834_004228 [Tilletia horrida]KAK0529774.1 hypothetical protein OC835_004233 [Tilletia horrida]